MFVSILFKWVEHTIALYASTNNSTLLNYITLYIIPLPALLYLVNDVNK